MRRSLISCFALALVITLLGTIGLYRDAGAGLSDDGPYVAACAEDAAAAVVPLADEAAAGGGAEEQLPMYAQRDPQNSCTKCEKGKKRCCIGSDCRTVSC